MGMNIDYLRFEDQSFLNIHTKYQMTERIEFQTIDFFREFSIIHITEDMRFYSKYNKVDFRAFENKNLVISASMFGTLDWIDVMAKVVDGKIQIANVHLYFNTHVFSSSKKNKYSFKF